MFKQLKYKAYIVHGKIRLNLIYDLNYLLFNSH